MGKCGKGTGSFGLRNKKSHVICRRCGKVSLHQSKLECASCGWPSPKKRTYKWSMKSIRRRAQGTGRERFVRKSLRAAKAGHHAVPATSRPKRAPVPVKKQQAVTQCVETN